MELDEMEEPVTYAVRDQSLGIPEAIKERDHFF